MSVGRQFIAGLWILTFAALLFGGTAGAVAQEKPPTIPDPEDDIAIDTDDGVILRATFYPSWLGKEAVPILIIHDYEESRKAYDAVALGLQKQGHAVLVPDMRGHGDSVARRTGPAGRGRERVDAARFVRRDFEAMFVQDLRKMRTFLKEKNNAGQLNLNKLCVVGCGGMGTVLGMNWTAKDWSYPVLRTGKQGQDVHGMVLISPEWSFKGLGINNAMRSPAIQQAVSTMLVVGDQGSVAAGTKRINDALKRFRPEPPPERVKEEKTLFYQKVDTKLQGTDLLTSRSYKVPAMIAQFVRLRLVDQEYPWSERRSQ